MKHLKYFNINENYLKLTSDKIDSIGSKLFPIEKPGFYEFPDFKKLGSKPQEFRDIDYLKQQIKNIFGNNVDIKGFNYLSFNLGELDIIIKLIEDEWFIVSISYTIRLNGSKLKNDVIFQCDQEDGLLALLKDFKSIIDKHNI
jgi:hypothetical protein